MKKAMLFIPFLALAAACVEESVGSLSMDTEAPGQVTDIKVTNVPGGADITYQIPENEDLLYVKAYYNLENGRESNVMVSMYEDSLKIRGFSKPMEHEVRITTGDRSRNESEPVITKINPLRSPIFDVLDNLKMTSTFGGINLQWQNDTKSALAITLLKRISDRKWEEINTYYSNALKGNQSARGMEARTEEFAVFIRDRWENATDTITRTLTPLFEEQFPVGSYKKFAMKGDSEISYGWDLSYALDGDLTQPWGWFARPTVEGGVWPARFTVKIEGGAILSRVRIVQRHEEMWENGNPKKFRVLGCNEPKSDGSDDGWDVLQTFTSVKPSGYGSGQYSDEDAYVAKNGEDFEFPAGNTKRYEYYRFEFLENWGGDNTFINLLEVMFYGKLT